MADDDESAYEKAVRMFDEEYLLSKEDDHLWYSSEGAYLGETLLKITRQELESESIEDDLGWAVERFTLIRISHEIREEIDEMRGEDNWKEQVKLIVSDDVLLFFTLANEFLNGMSGQILEEEIVPDQRKGESSTNFMINLNQRTKEDLLYYSGLIDTGLKGEMAKVRKQRNRLIHDLRNRHFLESIENLETELDRALEAVNKLHIAAEGMEIYQPE